MSFLCCFYWIQRHTWGLTRTGAHEKKTWGYPNVSSPLTTQALQPWSHPADDTSISKNSAASPHSAPAPASGEDRACPHFSDLQGWRMYRVTWAGPLDGWHRSWGPFHDSQWTGRFFPKLHSYAWCLRTPRIRHRLTWNSCAHSTWQIRLPIQYNETLSPLESKSVTAPPLCCSETACCSRRWLSGNCFLVCGIFLLQSTWIWFRGHVGHEIRRFARRALRLIWNAMTKSMATKSFLMRWKRKRFLGQIVWLEGGCTCLSEPLFVLASRESRWGAMSGCHA